VRGVLEDLTGELKNQNVGMQIRKQTKTRTPPRTHHDSSQFFPKSQNLEQERK